jgi:mannose-6-phosphate isomerase
MSTPLYPLQFIPIFKERIWGGRKLQLLLHKAIVSDTTGESWEISTVEENISIIANGNLKGKSLLEIINDAPAEVLGTEVYKKFGTHFPLLFKYLDATADLSIQVHPNDQLAKERHNSFGKTEMWYVVQADEDAKIIVGFKHNSSTEEYLEHLEDNTLTNILNDIKVNEGDVFFLETGTVHALGAGLLIAEIQQTSDITYRLYDFDRLDANGHKRELHVDQAVDAINYNTTSSFKAYPKNKNVSNEIVSCPYFTTHFLPLDGYLKIHKTPESFTVYMCVEGSFELKYENVAYHYTKGDTVLIPALLQHYSINGKASILEIYIS